MAALRSLILKVYAEIKLGTVEEGGDQNRTVIAVIFVNTESSRCSIRCHVSQNHAFRLTFASISI